MSRGTGCLGWVLAFIIAAFVGLFMFVGVL